MLEIPGYVWDPDTNRYYKDTSGRKRAPQSLDKLKATQQQQKAPAQGPATAADNDQPQGSKHDHSSIRADQRARKSSVRRLASSTTAYDAATSSPSATGHGLRDRLRHHVLANAIGRLQPAAVEEPLLTLGDAVTRFCFDHHNLNIVRYGTSYGLIGHGPLSDSRATGQSTTRWQADHILGNPITSVENCRGRFLWVTSGVRHATHTHLSTSIAKLLKMHIPRATSFGPVAQAVISSTASESVGTILLSPRKTSLWSASLSESHIALGCDKKVLIYSDLSRSDTRAFGTGSAVFALHQYEDQQLFAGTRGGHVKMFDFRSSASRSSSDFESVRYEVALRLPTSVTHVRALSDGLLLAVLINGEVALYDRRFLRHHEASAVMKLSGHQNAHSTGLGCDVYGSSLLALAGNDRKVRLWSLKTGQLVDTPYIQGVAGQASTSDEQIGSLRFREVEGRPSLWFSDGPILREFSVPIGATEQDSSVA